MSVLEAVVIGLVQGISEILPISSTAHILLLADLFNIPEPSIAATVFLNFGSFLAILLFFRKRWLRMAGGTLRLIWYRFGANAWYSQDDKTQGYYVLLLVIATVPAIVAGFFFEDIIAEMLRGTLSIAGALLAGGLLLLVADMTERRNSIEVIDGKRSFFIGLVQALALIPGFSRSGSAITGARLLKINREDAATFAFLMGAPVFIAAIVYQLPTLIKSGALLNVNLWLAFIIAAASTYAAIRFVLEFVKRQSYVWFVLYRAVLGGLLVLIAV